MNFWKLIIAHFVIVCLIGCTSTARMTALDRSLVNKKITRTVSGGAVIDMDGNFLLNPTAAIETFHTIAEKEMAGRPYRYTYAIDKKQSSRRVYEPGSSGGDYYTPVYLPPSSGGGGEAAIILGSIALIILIAKLATNSKKEKSTPTSPAPATATTSPSVVTQKPAFREETVTTRILRVSGTAEPVAPVTLDHSRLVEVLVPENAPTVGRLKPAVASAIADQVRQSFETLGCPTTVGSKPAQQGYRVSTSVLRSQGTGLTYSAITLEITLTDERTNRELARWLVQASEKPFDLKSQNERLYGPGIATGILQKPLATQLSRYLR
ncbi:MAG: hypothetical protein OJI67_04240 [Prosthecobacter sp.]|nr:hypothetical protein [Prosthecobacter sp.]